MLFGRWSFAPNEVFDANNTTHKEVQGVLDQIAKAADRKDAELLRPTLHPQYRLVGAVPEQPEAAVLYSAEDVLRNGAKAWRNAETIRYQDRIKKIHVRDWVALAQIERWFEMDGRTSHSFLLFLFCRTDSGWKQALEVTGDWRRFLTEETEDDANTPESRQSVDAESPSAKDIPDLCHRIRDAWAQRDFSPSRNLAWPDCFMVAGTDPQSHELLIMNSSDGTEALDAFLRSVDEVVPSTDLPVYEVQGPLAIIRWKKARLRMGENWHTIEGLDVAVERDGLWRCAASIDGDWKMTPEDRYDPSNEDHVALQGLLDQAGEAMVRKDARTFRELLHSKHSSVFAGPDGAQVMGINGYTDELLQELAHEKHQSAITAVKVTGPFAVTLSQLDLAVHGQTFTVQGVLNICGRTNDGWRQLVFVAGDWNNVLMAESEK